MIQLIDRLPFESTAIQSLKSEWTRFKDGRVTFDQVPDAICGEFECEAEMQVNRSCAGSGDEDEEYEKEVLKYLPSGHGKLIITISKLYWISLNDLTGWSIDYQHLLLHAISKPSESRPYIYLQLSCNKVYDTQNQEISFQSETDEDEEEKFVEVNLYVSEGEKAVDDIFVALSECTSLHPCEEDNSEYENESEMFEPQKKINKVDEERFEDATDE